MRRLLVIDYSPEIRELVMRQLEHLGYEAADGGAGGEAPAAGRPFDALVVEPVRPEALAFAALVRETSPELPILVISIEGSNPHTSALRPVAHLVKPVLLAELEAALERVRPTEPGRASAPGRAPRARTA